MRYEYIEPFAEATRTVLDRISCPGAQCGEISLPESGVIIGDVLVIVPVEGETPGNVVLSMAGATARRLATSMGAEACGTSPVPYLDVVAELANMIAGNAISALNDRGFDLTVLQPVILTKEQQQGRMPYLETCRIPVMTACGEVLVHVVMRNE